MGNICLLTPGNASFQKLNSFSPGRGLKKSCRPISCLHIWTLWPRTVKWPAHSLKTNHPQVSIVWFRSLLRGPFISAVSGANLCTVFHTTNYSLYLFSACFKNHHLCIYCLSFPTRMTIIFMEFCLLPCIQNLSHSRCSINDCWMTK